MLWRGIETGPRHGKAREKTANAGLGLLIAKKNVCPPNCSSG